MKPKKIAIIYSGAKFPGGIEAYLGNLFRYADSSRVKLTLFSLGEWGLTKKFQNRGYQVKVFSGSRINIGTIFKLAKVLRAEDYGLVVTHGNVANAYGRAASLFSGVPNLVTVHSESGADYQNPLLRSIYRFLDFVSRWRTKRYLAVSEYLKGKLIESGVKASKISVVYNGVPRPQDELKKEPKVNVTVIGSIGRLDQVKNFENLIRAFALISKGKDLKLRIAGDGPEREDLEGLIAELHLGNQVELAGYIEDVYDFLVGLNFYVQPSFSEGFGLTVAEAQLAGLPVVVTPGGSLPELVKDGQTGIIAAGFEPDDIAVALERFLSDSKLAANCSALGQKSAEGRFEIKEWAQKTVEVYLGAVK